MSKAQKQKNDYGLAAATAVAVFCMGQIPGSIDAAISKITSAFALTSTSGMYVATVSCITSVAFSILLSFIAGRKIGYKPLILFCAVVELFSAVAPFFTTGFALLLVLRGLFGIGFGGMQSLENTVVTALIPAERRARILGMGMFFGFGMNCVLQFIGGFLADIGWNYVFLNHLLLIIPFVIVLAGCARLNFKPAEQDAKPEADCLPSDKSEKLSTPIYQMWVMMLFTGVFIAPLLIGCSFLSSQINDSAAVAGTVAVFFSVGCMVGGLIYPRLFAKLNNMALPVFLLLMAAGLVGCGLARTIPLLCAAILVGGVGFSMTQASGMMILGLAISPKRIAMVSAIMMALFNLGVFLSSIFEEAVGAVTGDSLYMPLYIGAVILTAFAAAYALFSPLKNVR